MNILLVGCGKMGGALLENWKRGDEAFAIVDPFLDSAPEGVALHEKREEVADRQFDVIVAAIKPQMIDEVMPDYSDMSTSKGYLLSIAAGCSIARLKKVSGGKPVIRIMPNLPAAIGAGVSALCASEDATEAQLAHARAMMERTGTVITVEDEDAIDRFTAVAGSGPGYVFELARAYTEAAMALGFDEDQARAMVLGTLQGTVAMAAGSGEKLETLRNSVTSKSGTTAAGLNALNGKGELSALLSATLEAAYDRAVELR
ncbi:pyrroline-5-carboxylate reductase [Erythrobacter sp.]|uniref:pyrroline-5-carboxylate reductase n=1 Tax=Erythrobacter sp. TaxID=1042 RepID=UPI002EC40E9F|nr:pyrroline-5-carboxylate reductase [Erythrobacter sp.]